MLDLPRRLVVPLVGSSVNSASTVRRSQGRRPQEATSAFKAEDAGSGAIWPAVTGVVL
jgi:hypothetical protein